MNDRQRSASPIEILLPVWTRRCLESIRIHKTLLGLRTMVSPTGFRLLPSVAAVARELVIFLLADFSCN